MCVPQPRPCRWQIVCEYVDSKSVLFILRTVAWVSSSAVFCLGQMVLNVTEVMCRVLDLESSTCANISCFLFGLNVALNPDWTLTVPEVVFAGAHINIMFTLSSLNHRHGSSQELLLENVMLAQGQSHLKCLWCSTDNNQPYTQNTCCFYTLLYFVLLMSIMLKLSVLNCYSFPN